MKKSNRVKRAMVALGLATAILLGRFGINAVVQAREDNLAFKIYRNQIVTVNDHQGNQLGASRVRENFGTYIHSPIKLGDVPVVYEYNWTNKNKSLLGHRFVYDEADIVDYIVLPEDEDEN